MCQGIITCVRYFENLLIGRKKGWKASNRKGAQFKYNVYIECQRAKIKNKKRKDKKQGL